MVCTAASITPMAMPARDNTPVASLPTKLAWLGAGRVASSHNAISKLSVIGVPSSVINVGTRVDALAARSRASSAHGSTSVGSMATPFSIRHMRAMRT